MGNICLQQDSAWLFDGVPIIHRGRLSSDLVEHTKSAFEACYSARLPMEIDLLFLRDGEIVVWRDGSMSEYGLDVSQKVSDYTAKELRQFASASGNNKKMKIFSELMTFSEFLSYINGHIPLLIEIKCDGLRYDDEEAIRSCVYKVYQCLSEYHGRFAIHASNPYVLKAIRALDWHILCGQISWDFCGIPIEENYRKLHLTGAYVNIAKPDFISYKIQNFTENSFLRKMIQQMCDDLKINVIAWTVKSRCEEISARQLCSNYIIEGARSFL